MLLRHLKIENFRGIRSLSWHVKGRVVCMIGPSDATKTSILDAIELVSLPRSNVQVSDADFYSADPTKPISIEATFGELPVELITEPSKFGLCLRGYDETNTLLFDDPVDGTSPVITVRFEVGEDLEPSWTVVKTALPEPKRIGWQDRERLGVSRLGEDVDKHLTWARGSALAKLTAKNTTTAQTFSKVTRAAKKIVADSKLEELETAAGLAHASAKAYGAGFNGLKPGLDILGFPLGSSVLGLHDASVPVRLWGLGTKRLAALAIQQCGIGQNSVLLIDELEHGLEPHRLRLLLEKISQSTGGTERKEGQVIFTTHSPTAAMALNIEKLAFVRSKAGATTVETVKPEFAAALQSIARTQAVGFLGRKLVVCEGATEVGLCRGMAPVWAKEHADIHIALLGTVLLDGKGCTVAPGVALELNRVGYAVAVLADSDVALKPSTNELTAQGVSVVQWDGGVSTEERLAADLPLEALQQVVDAAIGQFGLATVLSHVSNFGGVNLNTAGDKISGWISPQFTEVAMRTAVGKAAKKGKIGGSEGWFKNVTLGTELGTILAKAIPQIPTTSLALRLKELATWIYG